MKSWLLMATLLATSIAAARESTPVEDAWFKLQFLTQGVPADAHGMSIPDPIALQQYVDESRAELENLSRAFWDDLCANRPTYESNRQQLIEKWELYVQEKESLRQSIIDGLSDVIGSANADAFFSYTAHSKRSHTIGFDATDIRSDEAARERMLSRSCERGEQT